MSGPNASDLAERGLLNELFQARVCLPPHISRTKDFPSVGGPTAAEFVEHGVLNAYFIGADGTTDSVFAERGVLKALFQARVG